jgi:TPR repeat protein
MTAKENRPTTNQKSAQKDVDYKKTYKELSKEYSKHSIVKLKKKAGSFYKNQDYIRARVCYELVAEKRVIEDTDKPLSDVRYALYSLGYLYEYGEGVKEDKKIAQRYYILASCAGSYSAKQRLLELNPPKKSDGWYKLGDQFFKKRTYESARECYFSAINCAGHPYPLYKLAFMYEKGLGGEKNINEANEYYERAINYKDSEGNSALMIFAKKPTEEAERQHVVRGLSEQGAAIHLINNKGETALGMAVEAKDKWMCEFLLINRKRISPEELEKIFTECVDECRGKRESERNPFLDKKIYSLGVNLKSITLDIGLKFFGNLNSLEGRVKRTSSDRKLVAEEVNLEGMDPQHALILRVRIHFELALKIALGEIPDNLLPKGIERLSLVEKIKKELLVNLELLHAYRDTEQANNSKDKTSLIKAQAENIAKKIEELGASDEYSYSTGWTNSEGGGHCINVNFFRKGDFIYIRVDNVGGGCDKHTTATRKDKKIKVVRPYSIGRVTRIGFADNVNNIKYLNNIIKAQFKDKKEALKLIYQRRGEEVDVGKEGWTAKKFQSSGNCSIASHNVGMHFRFSGGRDDLCPGAKAYKWLLKNEEEKWKVRPKL